MKQQTYNKRPGIDVTQFSEEQLDLIKLGLDVGIDPAPYCDPQYDVEQMEEILSALDIGVDIKDVTPDWHPDDILEYRAELQGELERRLFGDGLDRYDDSVHAYLLIAVRRGFDINRILDPNIPQSDVIPDLINYGLPAIRRDGPHYLR